MKEVMLDEFNYFDYGINDDFAKNLAFTENAAEQAVREQMENHYRVNPYEYDSTHAVKFSEWVFVP